MRQILTTALVIFIPFSIIAQSDCCLFGDKLTTKLDSITLTKKGIKKIKIYYSWPDDTIEQQIARTVDVNNCSSTWCLQVVKEERTKSKIIQTVQWTDKKPDQEFIRIHYMDKNGLVIKTEFKSLKGLVTARILYEYSENLVTKAILYDGEDNNYALFMKVLYRYE
ncbi:MAG: hypothetical protein IPG89_09530 [Bacteroidetes bacterium]|nr:hypothetical protein [Bacteroidota bacterium]